MRILADNINEQYKVATYPSRKGSIKEKGEFYGCSGYHEGCKVRFPKKLAGKNISRIMIKSLCDDSKVNKLKGFRSKKVNNLILN